MRDARHTQGERGSALVVALLLIVLLLLLGGALLGTSEAENVIAANDASSEGAFYAAEAAVQAGIDQLGDSAASRELPVAITPIGGSFTYRSGGRDDNAPQPPTFVATVNRPGFAAGTNTGYNQTGYAFQVYQINGTGTGPRNAVREVEVQVEYGPVAQ